MFQFETMTFPLKEYIFKDIKINQELDFGILSINLNDKIKILKVKLYKNGKKIGMGKIGNNNLIEIIKTTTGYISFNIFQYYMTILNINEKHFKDDVYDLKLKIFIFEIDDLIK